MTDLGVMKLSEYAKLQQDELTKGVTEEIMMDSPILPSLPFKTLDRQNLIYNVEDTLGTVKLRDYDDKWDADSSTVKQRSVHLFTLGGDVDVPNFVQDTFSSLNDQRRFQIEKKTKSMKYTFEQLFLYGDKIKNFDGLQQLYDHDRRRVNANGHNFDVHMLDELIDKVIPKPDAIYMCRYHLRVMKQQLRNTESFTFKQDEYGNRIRVYDGIPIYVSDFIKLDPDPFENYIWALCMGEDAVCGLQNNAIQVDDLGNLESYDATRIRIKWYVGLALFNTLKCACINNMRGEHGEMSEAPDEPEAPLPES